jgi:hypothetical protein
MWQRLRKALGILSVEEQQAETITVARSRKITRPPASCGRGSRPMSRPASSSASSSSLVLFLVFNFNLLLVVELGLLVSLVIDLAGA